MCKKYLRERSGGAVLHSVLVSPTVPVVHRQIIRLFAYRLSRVPPASVLYCHDKGWINISVHVRGFYALIPAHIYASRVGFIPFLMSSDGM